MRLPIITSTRLNAAREQERAPKEAGPQDSGAAELVAHRQDDERSESELAFAREQERPLCNINNLPFILPPTL
jgi:hypothetical protein